MASVDIDDHLSLRVPLTEVPESVANLVERVRLVDNGREIAAGTYMIAREVAKAAALTEIRQPLQDIGIVALASSPEDTRKLMAADIARWSRVVQQAKIERQ